MPAAVAEVTEYSLVCPLAAECRLFRVEVFFYAEHVGGEAYQPPHVLHGAAAAYEPCAVITQVVPREPGHGLALCVGVTLYHAAVALVCHLFANVAFVVRNENALPVPVVLGVELYCCVQRRAATGEEVEDMYSVIKMRK